MRDEEKYPTVRFIKCRRCQNIFAESLSGDRTCPKCQAAGSPEDGERVWFRKVALDSHYLFVLTGSVFRLADLEKLKGEVEECLAADPRSLGFEFASALFLDSAMVNLLARCARDLSRRGRDLHVVGSSPQILENLHMVNLDKVVRVHPGLEDYGRAIGWEAGPGFRP